MAKRKSSKRKIKKPFNRAVYEKLENKLLEAQDAMLADRFEECLLLCNAVLVHRKATKRQKSEASQFCGNMFMKTQDFSLACKALTAAIDFTPNDWMLYFNRSTAMMYTSQIAQALQDIEQAAALCDDEGWLDKMTKQRTRMRKAVDDACSERGPTFTPDDLLEQQTLFHEAMEEFEAEAFDSAEVKFKRVIALGDVLPQPWFNLGSIYLLREEWDSAETAWKRALEVDPDYPHARDMLKQLPAFRAGRELPQREQRLINDPFKGKIDNLTFHMLDQ